MNIDKKILAKVQRFCAYRERCKKEVKEKLLALQVKPNQIEAYTILLEDQRFINEQRFAIAYTLDKFKLNKWGKQKIKIMLQQYGIEPEIIQFALTHIVDSDYERTICQLINNYQLKLKKTPDFQRKNKTIQYLIGKGFEGNIVEKIYLI